MNARSVRFNVVLLAATVAAGCGGGDFSSPFARSLSPSVHRHAGSQSPIQHIVVIVQENRTFNDFFAQFPGADGTTSATAAANSNCSPPITQGQKIALTEEPLVLPSDLDHKFFAFREARDQGRMDGFDKVLFGNGIPECTYPYMYTDPSQIQQYWQMAEQYTLAEHMFSTQGSGSFTAHQDLIAGSTVVAPNRAMVDLPSCSGNKCIWGCDAPKTTITHLITPDNILLDPKLHPGPFPCTNQYQEKNFPTMRDLLDAGSITWKYYVPPQSVTAGRLFSAFDAIAAVRYSSEWTTNVISPQTQIYNDAEYGQLADVSWVMPDMNDSDHPGQTVDTGPQWVASVVNAIGKSQYWNSTAIIIVWDDWGGIYDNLKPEERNYGGLGFRVPAIVVSPYAKPGYISKTSYEFGSILKYIENNWDLGTLGKTDQHANNMLDCFNYNQSPLRFRTIKTNLSESYFIHRKPSYKPVDDY